MSKTSQFILITHNKRTMEMVDTLYGVTMEEPGVSKLVSVRLSGADGRRRREEADPGQPSGTRFDQGRPMESMSSRESPAWQGLPLAIRKA